MNVKTGDVCVIIPTYRRPQELRRAVESALAQTVRPAEVVIVDDNRDDPAAREASHAIAMDHRPVVTVLEHSGRPGGSAARNAGADRATAAVLAFLDDDDWWMPTKLERQLAALHRHPETVGIVFTGLRVVDEAGTLIRERIASVPAMPHRELARQNFIGTVSSVLIPRSVFSDVGGFDPDLPARQDLDLWLRIADRWPIVAVSEALTVYVNHTHGISKDFSKKIDAHERFLQKHRDIYETDAALEADYHYATAILCLKHHRHALARRYLLRSLKARPTLRAMVRFLQARFSRGQSTDTMER